MKRKVDKNWLYKYYNSQDNDAFRMYEGGGFRVYKQKRRLGEIRKILSGWDLVGKYILDIGCGDGYACRNLLGGISCKYIGLDYSIDKLKRMNSRFEKHGAAAGDAQCLPVSAESVDYVLCLETLEHLIDPGATLKEICRVLKRGGGCIISVPINSAPQSFIKKAIRKIKESRVFDEHIQTFTVKGIRCMLQENNLSMLAIKFCGFNIPALNILFDRIPYGVFEKLDGFLSNVPLAYLGAGTRGRVSFGLGNEYVIIAAKKM